MDPLFATLAEIEAQSQSAALITVIRAKGSTPRAPGARMIVMADGRIHGTIGGGRLEQLAREAALEAIASGEAAIREFPLGAKAGQCCGGYMELFIEPLNHGPRLFLFGAGHVGQALCQVLDGTPFIVHLIDPRQEWIEHPDLPSGIQRHHCEWFDFNAEASFRDDGFIAVMSHLHDIDQAIIEDVVGRPARYIGLIGSQTKWRRFRKRLEAKGLAPETLDRVHCPIGLNTGGKAPKEVAISIAAELLQTYYRG